MTLVRQTRHIFDLSDVRAIRFECDTCGTELVQSLDKVDIYAGHFR